MPFVTLPCPEQVNCNPRWKSSPLHPELTWRRLNPALPKFSGDFLTLIVSVMRDRASIPPCFCSMFPAVGLVFSADSVCPGAHALTEAVNPVPVQTLGARHPATFLLSHRRTLSPASLSLEMFRARLVSAYVVTRSVKVGLPESTEIASLKLLL